MPGYTVLYGGELAKDVASRMVTEGQKRSVALTAVDMEGFKNLNIDSEANNVIFVIQTIENNEPPETAGTCVRFFKRKTHPADLLAGKLSYTVLGLGDSNLLLDRQTTTAKDCNKVGQDLDKRLQELGATRIYDLGLADERTGLTEVDPWIAALLSSLKETY